MTDDPGRKLIAAVKAMKPELEWSLEELTLMRGDLVWLAFCGAPYDYADAMRRIEACEVAVNELLEALR